MTKLSETLARLTLQKRAITASYLGSSSRLSAHENFGLNPGGLRMKYYVPEALPAGAALVVVLHGCTQTSGAYDAGAGWSQLADQEHFALLFPEQQASNNPNLCFNWFLPEDTKRNSGEAHSIFEMIETLASLYQLDNNRIFITGLSAGGAMATAMLASYPEVFAAGAIIAGLPHGTASSIPEAFERMRGQGNSDKQRLQELLRNASEHDGPWPRLSIWHGAADMVVAPSNSHQIASQWQDVLNVSEFPTRSQLIDGHARSVWSNHTGDDVMEMNMINRMGHGTPLMTYGPDGLGSEGPFMLEMGVSSTRRIAEFFGIAVPAERDMSVGGHADSSAGKQGHSDLRETKSRIRKQGPDSYMPSFPSTGVRSIIEDALRKAGLMR